MLTKYCCENINFIHLSSNAPKFFGFSDYLTGLALLVLAWTIADVRYHFRVRTAPIPLLKITFLVVGAVGFLSLLTDWWRAEQWLVPQGNLISPAGWQALLATAFLITFLTWAWFAFIRAPIYGKRNCKRYAQFLYRAILKGSVSELSVIADELTLSAKSLIHYATDMGDSRIRRAKGIDADSSKKLPNVTALSNDILLLISDKRFCRAIVDSSPATALVIFQEIADSKKYGIQIKVFAKNIMSEAISNKDSFLFHEAEGYESGFLGYVKPLSHAMFSNYQMVETIDTFFDQDYDEMRKWDADQWGAYSRAVLIVFRDYIERGYGGHSFVLYRAIGHINGSVSELYKLNGVSNSSWDSDINGRLRNLIDFIKHVVKALEAKGVPEYLQLRVRDKNAIDSIYDNIASMIFEVILSASSVKSPPDLCLAIQHNSVWGEIFNFHSLNGEAAKVLKFKVRRLIYNEIAYMKEFPNYKGARILAFCLNVMGVKLNNDKMFRDSRALQKALLSWTTKNYTWLHSYNSNVAEACLVEGFTFDAANTRLIKAYPANGLRRQPHYEYLKLEPAPVT